MTNVYGAPEKRRIKTRLFEIGVEALKAEGWTVERAPGLGKSSLRRITRGKEAKLISIRTTQDTAIAFPRTLDDGDWVTLGMVDAVVAVSIADPADPRTANVHFIEGDEMRGRFDRAYSARTRAGHSIPLGRGVWLSLYTPEADDPVSCVGAGAGLTNPPMARVALDGEIKTAASPPAKVNQPPTSEPLSIAEARLRLATTFGVEPENVKIIIEA